MSQCGLAVKRPSTGIRMRTTAIECSYVDTVVAACYHIAMIESSCYVACAASFASPRRGHVVWCVVRVSAPRPRALRASRASAFWFAMLVLCCPASEKAALLSTLHEPAQWESLTCGRFELQQRVSEPLRRSPRPGYDANPQLCRCDFLRYAPFA